MDDHLDALARGLGSGKLTRRQAARGVAVGMGAALLALLMPATANAKPCPEGQQKCGGAHCCPPDHVCCKIQGDHFCCPTGGLVNVGCPGQPVNCIRVL